LIFYTETGTISTVTCIVNCTKDDAINMLTVCFRLVIIYITVLLCLRIMGKRQIGELDVSELVTAVFISELSTKPITDTDVPLVHGIIPTMLLLCIEIILSFTSVKSATFKRMFAKNPTFLINKGTIDNSALTKVRITLNELVSEMRVNGIADISQIYYAILEPNGKISFCLKSRFQPTTPDSLDLKADEAGISHMVICDGDINYSALKLAGKSTEWLRSNLKKLNLNEKNVFLMTVNDSGNIYIIKKDKA